MATAIKKRDAVKEYNFSWEAKDKKGKAVKGDMIAASEAVVAATLRRQSLLVTKVRKQRSLQKGKVTSKDITLFTRQLSTMMKAGVPLLQAFDIVGKGHSKPCRAKTIAGY